MTIRFGVIGAQHDHVIALTELLLEAGAEPVSFHEADPRFARLYAERFPAIPAAASEAQILDDPRLDLIVIVTEPARRAAVAVAALRRGKDVALDKPAVVSRADLASLRAAQRETGRIVSVFFSEHFHDRVTIRALELVRSGAIGEVVHISSLSAHKIGVALRPDWFYDGQRYGGILNDLISHHIHQFILFTGSERATVASARAANLAHPQQPQLEDFGDILLASERATGYARVDWLTPAGLPTWGDVRMFITGTTGSLELRKTINLGASGQGALYWISGERVEVVDCAGVPFRYGQDLLHDISRRTETVMAQAHCFRVCELALDAVDLARRGAIPVS